MVFDHRFGELVIERGATDDLEVLQFLLGLFQLPADADRRSGIDGNVVPGRILPEVPIG